MHIARKTYGSVLILLLTVFLTLSPLTSSAQETIRIGGTGSALGAMKLIAKTFEKSNSSTKIIFMPSIGSSGAVRAVAKGSLDIGLMARPLINDELTLGLVPIVYAKSPFVPVIHNKMRINNVTSRDVESIYKGTLKTWKNGEHVRLVLRPASDVDTGLIREMTPEMNSLVDAALQREGMLLAKTDQDNVSIIEKTPGAFGFSTLTQIIAEKRKIRVLSLNGVRPNLETLASGSYPFSKTFSLITVKQPSRPVKIFCDFVRSAVGRTILEETGNIPLSAEAAK